MGFTADIFISVSLTTLACSSIQQRDSFLYGEVQSS